MVSGIAWVNVDGRIINANQGDVPCWIESKDLEFNSPLQVYIDTFVVHLRDKTDSTAFIQFGWKDRLEDEIKWGDEFSLSDYDKMHWTRITGRYIKIRIRDDSPSFLWKISNIEIFGAKSGGRL